MSRPIRTDYIAFNKESIPDSAFVAESRTGQPPSMWVSANQVNVFAQTRGSNAHEGLKELKDALRIGDSISIIQPPTIGLFTLGGAKRYLKELNSCWKTNYEYSTCNLLPGENRFSLAAIIAGHRRTLASLEVAREITGEDDPELWIPVQHQIDPSFYDGLRTQYQENSHRAVPLWQEANTIVATLRWGRGSGQLQTFTDVAAYLGISAERVSNAVSYDSLPESIKLRVREGSLTQQSALYLERIGSSLALRMLAGVMEDDIRLSEMKSKLYMRHLRVDELIPHLTACGLLEEWESTLNAELTRLLAKEDVRRYVIARTSELIGDGQLFDFEGGIDPLDARVNSLLAERKRLQSETVRSLRILLSALSADRSRLAFAIEHPEHADDSSLLSTPIIANSPNSRRTWSSIVDQMKIIQSMESPDSEILIALDAVVGYFSVLASESAIESVINERATEFTEILEQLRNIIRIDGASTNGIGEEFDMALVVLQQAVRSTIKPTNNELF